MCLSGEGQFCVTTPSLRFVDPTFDVCKYNTYCRETEQNTNFRHCECDYQCYSNRPELKLTNQVINSTLGIMEVMFTPFTLCNYSSYDIILSVNESIPEDKCQSITDSNVAKHSSRTVLVEVCEPDGMCISKEPCDENVTVVFNHVFTGCYLFQIIPKDGSNTRRRWSLPKYIVTDYIKLRVTEGKLNFSVQYKNSESMEVSVAFPFLSRASLLTLIEGIDPSLGLDACHESGHIHSSCKMCTDESDIKCDDKDLKDNVSCKYLSGVLSCDFHNVPPGNYCARVDFLDDRCETSTTWTNAINPCIWSLDIEAADRSNLILSSPVRPEPSNYMTTFTVGLILVVFSIFLLTFLAFVVYWKLFAQYHVFIPPNKKELKPLHIKERPIVLLLYARDCDVFMNVMAEFRSVLKSSLKCQVFDCWDPVQYERVAQSPTDWVLSLIADRSVRIILVATSCSRLLEMSLLTDKKVQYRLPDAFDKLFIFALRHLVETTILDSYNRIFVVRLDKNAQNNNSSLTYLNPLTVYSLPTHLDKLMLGLHRVNAMEYAVSILDLPDVKHFSLCVESFHNFVHENPYYLDFFLEKVEPDIV